MADINSFADLSALDAASLDAVTETPVEATAPVEAAAAPAKPIEGSTEAMKKGAAIYNSLSDEERATLNSTSGSVHFLSLLGANCMPNTRVVKDASGATTQVPSNAVVGIRLKTDIDLEVPVIPFKKLPHDIATIPDFDTIQYRTVHAGEEFFLNRVEAMYLFTLPKYGLNGYCEAQGDPKAVAFVPKFSEAYRKNGLPTPTWRFTDSKYGQIKSNMVLVDETDANGGIVLKPEYAEAFADLAVARVGRRSGGVSASNAPTGTKVSLAIASLLTSK